MDGDPNTYFREEDLKRGKEETALEGLGPLMY